MKDDTTQFALAPFAPQQTFMQDAVPAMAASNSMQPDFPSQQDQMKSMYPEIYHDVYPMVLDAVNQLISSGVTLTPEITNRVVDNIIRNSGMWYEDEEPDEAMWNQESEVVPVQFGFGGTPYRRRRRRHHNRRTLRDIVRILLLNEVFRKNGSFPGYY